MIREGQVEPAHVWTAYRDRHLATGRRNHHGSCKNESHGAAGVKVFHTTSMLTNIGMAYGSYLRPGCLRRRSSPGRGHARLAPSQVSNATPITARASFGNATAGDAWREAHSFADGGSVVLTPSNREAYRSLAPGVLRVSFCHPVLDAGGAGFSGAL